MRQPEFHARRWRTLGVGVTALGLVAFGASTVLAQTGKPQAETRSVTFAKDVAPILQAKCEVCHRADGMAPMPLTTFDEMRPWARSIKTKVADRVMPPWYVSKTVGIQKFANDRPLTDDEIATIVRWVDSGAALGNPKDLPAPKRWPVENEWEFAAYFGRPPDLVIKGPEYKVPAVSQDIWWQPMAEMRVPEDHRPACHDHHQHAFTWDHTGSSPEFSSAVADRRA
jgi:hypothetical protein